METITAAYTGVWAFSAANGQDVWPIQRFLFVGWSDANKRMQMFEVASIDKQPFTLKWHEDVYLHPHITEFPKVPRAEEDLVEYAILQSRGIALEYPGVAGAGGLLMGCELQQDHSLRCSQLADLSLQREPNFARFMDGESACASVN